MNSHEALKELIAVYPIKQYGELPEFNWLEGELAKNEIISRFDTEILTMTNVALLDHFGHTNYMLLVGSRFGTMTIKDEKADILSFTSSYYLVSGILYGTKGKKDKFEFDIRIVHNKNGLSFIDFENNDNLKGEVADAYKICRNSLNSFFVR